MKHGRREFVKSLAGPNSEKECILRAAIDLNEIPRAKFDFRVVGTSE